MIDRWFPCAEVTDASSKPYGSGRIEKAMITWFASRPIAQARAAVLTTLLPWPESAVEQETLRRQVAEAVTAGDATVRAQAMESLSARIGCARPRVLDMFSGRGIIPLEAARAGAEAWGVDYSPVATLGGLLLADYPFRDWPREPRLPFQAAPRLEGTRRLLQDVQALLDHVARRHETAMGEYYPRNVLDERPWGYLWARTMPCSHCGRRFPLVGSAILRHPGRHGRDPGQALRICTDRDAGTWTVKVIDGTEGTPTFTSTAGGGRGGKVAQCPFCGQAHTAAMVKARAAARVLEDALLVVADDDAAVGKRFRQPTRPELEAVAAAAAALTEEVAFADGLPAVPHEEIPPGNNDIVRASLYGARTYGDLACARQTLGFVRLCRIVRDLDPELERSGVGEDYRRALLGYAGALLVRKIRWSTRGASLRAHNDKTTTVQVDHIFKTQTAISHGYDFFEAGIGNGPGTLRSLAKDTLVALRRVLDRPAPSSAKIRHGSALRLPFRDGSVDAIVTDPPYQQMIAYTDASDLFHVWLKRALGGVYPELFDTGIEL